MKLDLADLYWLHDDWFLYFKCGDYITSRCTEEDPEWFGHYSGECKPDCPKCQAIWAALVDKYAGDVLVEFGLAGRGQTVLQEYDPDQWSDAVWYPVWGWLQRLRAKSRG